MSRWIARSQARQRLRRVAPMPCFRVDGFERALARARRPAPPAMPSGSPPPSPSLRSSVAASATSGIALFLPRIGVVVVSADFPVAGLVGLDELDAGDPLRA